MTGIWHILGFGPGACNLIGECAAGKMLLLPAILAAMTLYGIYLYYLPIWRARRAGLTWRQIRRNTAATRRRARTASRRFHDRPGEVVMAQALDGSWFIDGGDPDGTTQPFRMICMIIGVSFIVLAQIMAVVALLYAAVWGLGHMLG